ncbi:hypothetical protein EPO15_02165 [bacterium]|nr:MAG: hypothetical protein EPO15_02165 [bacterium]
MEHLLVALLLASPLPAAAQVVRARAAAPAEAPAEKPEPSCVCSRYNYKPLNAKGTAAKEYWDARGKAKISRGISGITALFGYLAQSGSALNAAQNSYSEAMSALSSARAKAEAAGAVKVVGEDFEEESIDFLLKNGVDYALTD